MDYGLIAGLSALLGVLCNFIRIGEWKARQETRIGHIEENQRKTDEKIDELNKSVNKLNELLAVLTERLEAKRRKKHD